MKTLEQQVRDQRTTASPKVISMKPYLQWAAVILLVVAPTIYFFNQSPSNEQLFAQNFEPYPNYAAAIERGSPNADQYVRAFQLYEEGNYSQAIGALSDLLKILPHDVSVEFYLAMSFLSSGQPQASIPHFQMVLGSVPNNFDQQSEWYLALAYVQHNQPSAALKYLESLVEKEGFQHQKAAELLSEL